LKKIPQTDAIFENVFRENQASDDNPKSLRLSLDTQFIKRMVELSGAIDLRIRLIYYPPYHSKYNPIERCWAALENYWNGAILDSVSTAVQWASNMKWKGVSPLTAFSRDNLSNRSQSSSWGVKTLSISMATLSYFTPMGYHHCSYLIGILFSCESLRTLEVINYLITSIFIEWKRI
jgi:hypothetical protein